MKKTLVPKQGKRTVLEYGSVVGQSQVRPPAAHPLKRGRGDGGTLRIERHLADNVCLRLGGEPGISKNTLRKGRQGGDFVLTNLGAMARARKTHKSICEATSMDIVKLIIVR